MLAKARNAGAIILCDVCQREIVAKTGLILWQLKGQANANAMSVHATCEQSPVVEMLMPEHRSMPLGVFLEQVLERISV